MAKSNKKFEDISEEYMNIADKEEEIVESYKDDEIEEYEFEEAPKKRLNISKIVNIIFIVIVVCILMIVTDIVCVSKYNAGPFFAIPLHKYNDGGTKEYYGLGYKVIKYNQVQGRRDKEIGFWNLKYNSNPITLQDIDLTIEMHNNEVNTYKKYYKRFVRIISTLKKVDTKNNTITMSYQDEDNKYSLDIICEVVKEQGNLSKLETDKETTIIGTVSNFKIKTKKTNNKLYISNCFVEQ